MRNPQEPDTDYLTDVSPKDKPWDVHKQESTKVRYLYQGTVYDRYAGRIDTCSGHLAFCWAVDPETGEHRLKLKACRFCRVRHCPVCQWRRTLMWLARFLRVLPVIQQNHPNDRFIFLTLTVRNPPMQELRSTLKHMNQSWRRLIQRRQFPAIGFARSTEVTKGKHGDPHPHFHALLLVKSTYFKGTNYLSKADWLELWRDCLQVNYLPSIAVKVVKPNAKRGTHTMQAAIAEVFKYSVKPDDLFGKGTEEDRRWLVELTEQLQNTRAIALGGVLRKYLSESEPEDLITEQGDEDLLEEAARIHFGFQERIGRYVKEQRE